jgi:hypothetical protein
MCNLARGVVVDMLQPGSSEVQHLFHLGGAITHEGGQRVGHYDAGHTPPGCLADHRPGLV